MLVRRRLGFALLVLAVVLAHGGLLAPPTAWPGRHGRAEVPPPAMQVRALAAEGPAPPPLPAAAKAAPAPPAVVAPSLQPADAPAAAPTRLAGAPPPEAQAPSADLHLRYQVVRGDAVGEGELVYAQDAEAGYTLALRAQVPGMKPLDWRSSGRVDAGGLAPLRLEERQRGRTVRAVNFQRDKGLISYSGPTRTDPLRPGAQDRLSLLLHLPALVRATPGRSDWAVQVALPGGSAEVWHLAQRDEPGATVLTREPERPYDWQLVMTLPAAAPQWPLRMVWTLVPGGEPVVWTLLAPPPTASSAAPPDTPPD